MRPAFNLVAETIRRTAELGLTITGTADVGDITVITADLVESRNQRPGCGRAGRLHDHDAGRLADLSGRRISDPPARVHRAV
jgi:transposase